MLPTAVIGAGPHGLSAVAHLRDAGIPTVAFGRPMSFWRDTMPAGMLLRSSPRASNIASPRGELSLAAWSKQTGRPLPDPIPIADFIDYGIWFQQRAIPDLDTREVLAVREHGDGFELELSGGERMRAARVVVSAGLGPFSHVPQVFRDLPSSLVSHTAASLAPETFAGRSVAVIGAGQSSLEAAALLDEAGATVEVIARAESIYWLGSWINESDVAVAVRRRTYDDWRHRHGLYMRSAPTELGLGAESWLAAAPDVVRHVPRRWRAPLTYRCIRPAGAHWLPDRLRAVGFRLGRQVVSALERDGQVLLRLDDGQERHVDHVILGTGYCIDVRRYPFLEPGIGGRLRVVNGSPQLRGGLVSSVPGLHFVGAAAAESFGPSMRFVVGTAYTGRALAEHMTGRRIPALRWSF